MLEREVDPAPHVSLRVRVLLPAFHSVPILYSEACSPQRCNPASLRSSALERPFIKSIGFAVPSAAPMPNHSATTTRLCNYPCLALRQNREKNNAASFVFRLCPSSGRSPRGSPPRAKTCDVAWRFRMRHWPVIAPFISALLALFTFGEAR